MNIVEQSGSIINGLKPMEHIEKIGRICYKSEDKISDGTANKFIEMLYERNHMAMLEHYRFIMRVPQNIYKALVISHVKHFEITDYGRKLISFNARALIEMFMNAQASDELIELLGLTFIQEQLMCTIVQAYDCHELFGFNRNEAHIYEKCDVEFIPNSKECMSDKEWVRHGWKSIHFVTDRGISHELVRHREEVSFAQESTRYCNYSNNRFGGELTFIDQGFESKNWDVWSESCANEESNYFKLINNGIAPQMARSVLPTCLKTEIVVTAPIYEWYHIVGLRYIGTTGAPHPMMKELIGYVVKELD